MTPTRTALRSPRRALAALLAILLPATAAAGPRAAGGGPISIPRPKNLAAAVAAIEKATGAKAGPLELDGRPVAASEGRSFSMEGHLASRLVEGSHAAFLGAGLMLIRYERSFGIGDGHDHVALLKTTDRDAIIRRVGTSDPTRRLTTDQIVAWLAALNADEPFDLLEVGEDYVAGRFRAVPRDPRAVAQRCAEVAPELVKGSGSAIDLLTEEIRVNRTLYLIW